MSWQCRRMKLTGYVLPFSVFLVRAVLPKSRHKSTPAYMFSCRVCIGPAFLDLRAFSKWHQEEASVEERNFSRIVLCSSFLLQCSHLVTPLIPTAFCNNGNTSLTFFTFSSSQCHSKSHKREVHRQGWKFTTSSSACCCNAVYFKRYVSQ